MDVKDIQKYTDAGERRAFELHGYDLAVGGGNGYVTGRYLAIGIAEEPETERRDEVERNPERRPCKVGNDQTSYGQRCRVIDSVAHHAELIFSHQENRLVHAG